MEKQNLNRKDQRLYAFRYYMAVTMTNMPLKEGAT